MINENHIKKQLASEEAEYRILALTFTDPTRATDLIHQLQPRDFYNPTFRYIFLAIRSLVRKGKPVDVSLVKEYLITHKIPIDTDILDTMATQYILADVPFYWEGTIEIIKYFSYLRKAVDVGQTLIKKSLEFAGQPETPIDKIKDDIEKLVTEYLQYERKDDFVALRDVIPLLREQLVEKQANNVLYPTYIPSLDRLIGGGFAPDELVIVAGRPSMGKTALAIDIAVSNASRGTCVLFFSLEMPKCQIVSRILASVMQVPIGVFRQGKYDGLSEKDRKRVLAMLTQELDDIEVSRLPIYINDNPSLNVYDIKSVTRKFARKCFKAGFQKMLVVIDYLQLITLSEEERRYKNRVLEIGIITSELKKLARELHIPVIVLSQLSRAVEQRADKKPQLSDLRESGTIEQDADIVMLLYRDDYYNPATQKEKDDSISDLEIIVAKHRQGKTGTVTVKFDKATNYVFDVEKGEKKVGKM